MIKDIPFLFLAIITLFSAIMVIASKNPVHSILYLIFTFFTLTVHYIKLNAQFISVVNIVVYAGAIMVLFLFTIMFLNLRTDTEPSKPVLLKFAAVIAGGLIFVLISASFIKSGQSTLVVKGQNSQIGMIEVLGKVLFKEYLLPFELASILFLVAMVGAIMLGKKEKRIESQATLISSEKIAKNLQLEEKSEYNLLKDQNG